MKKLYRILGVIALLLSAGAPAWAQGTVPFALTQQVDINGKPLAGALLYTYAVGTVAQPQNTFQDTNLSILNPWPLSADQNGRIPMFYMAAGTTHVRLTDSSGNVQYDNPSVLLIGAAGGGGGGSTVDPTSLIATGDLKVKYGTGALGGFVRANGLTIGNVTSGATERANADTQNLFIYLYGADPNLVVSGGRTGNALNDFNSGKTIALPDWRGRNITALADMGNTASSVLTATYCSSPTTLGFACGTQSQTLLTTNLPPYTPAGAVGVSVTGTFIESAGCCIFAGGSSGGSNASPGGSGSFSGTPQGGTSTPFNTLEPKMLATIYIKL